MTTIKQLRVSFRKADRTQKAAHKDAYRLANQTFKALVKELKTWPGAPKFKSMSLGSGAEYAQLFTHTDNEDDAFGLDLGQPDPGRVAIGCFTSLNWEDGALPESVKIAKLLKILDEISFMACEEDFYISINNPPHPSTCE